MCLLLLIAGFCVLCLSGCVAILLVSQKLLHRAFDMIDFSVALLEQHYSEDSIDRPEVSD